MSYATDAIRHSCTAQSRIETPLGPLLLARTANGLAGAWFDSQQHHPLRIDAPRRPDDPLLASAAEQLQAYFAGAAAAFDIVLDLQGTPFQRDVWRELLALPHGATCSYGAIARLVGRPAAGRAVGAAVGRNPVAIIVPCHRVIGSGGALTGYAAGLDRKTALLAIEAGRRTVHAAAAPQLSLDMH